MRAIFSCVTLLCLLQACARTSCGPDTALERPREPPAEAKGVKNLATPVSSTDPLPEVRLGSKELKVLEKIQARRGGVSVRYVPPTPPELAAFAAWFPQLIRASESNAAPSDASPPGFELDSSNAQLWLAGERATNRRGAGAFVLRAGTAASWVIEAPHTFFDVGTLEIAVSCFELLNARALFVNSVRRSNSHDEELEQQERADVARSGQADSDLAHATQSFFATAHSAFAEKRPAYSTLQLHGFRDELLPSVSVVVSAAGTIASTTGIAQQLRLLLGHEAVRVYPSEVRKLGGTRNVQAKLSRASGAPFIHLELSRSLRDRLRDDPESLRTFATSLKSGLLETPER